VGEPVRVLVLGASGFLGSHIHSALERDGRTGEVVGVARTVPRRARAAGGGDPASSWRSIDLAAACPRRLEGLLDEVRPDVVVNAAGCTAGSAAELHALNTALVERLVRAVHRRLPGARLVHLGSAAEYGPATPGRPTSETDDPRPVGPYGETKLAATRLVWGAGLLGLDTVVLRVFNPVGAGMDARTLPGNAARRLVAAVAAGDRVVRLGPLGASRDFVAAADVASATVAAVHETRARGEIVNIGSGEARPARALVEALAAAGGYAGAVEEADEGSGRSAAVSWMEADITRARRVLGWRPGTAFDDAVRDLWRGALVNPRPEMAGRALTARGR
jgi:nucleoside-diphosphate-sugar epimerase